MSVSKNVSCFEFKGNCQQLPFFLAFKKRIALVSQLAMARLGGGRQVGNVGFRFHNYRAVNHFDGQDIPEAQTHLGKKFWGKSTMKSLLGELHST